MTLSNCNLLLVELIKKASITPNDAGCQQLIADMLIKHSFNVEHIDFGQVNNLWATHGSGKPLTVFAGHTDVVPVGDLSAWQYPPFAGEVQNSNIYGRGAADMKSGVAAAVIALTDYVKANPHHQGTVALMLTSDEEGVAVDGIAKLMPYLIDKGVKIDYAIFGEPSCEEIIGDTIKNGRRGSMHAYLTIKGKQGHVAYPEKAANPIHAAGKVIDALANEVWCNGNQYFPKTSMQIWEIKAGAGANNVVPASIDINFNFRFSTELSSADIAARTEQIVAEQLELVNIISPFKFSYELKFKVSGEPFITGQGKLVAALQLACQQVANTTAKLSTSGGTSDARFLAPYGIEVVEFGTINKTIHQVNECVSISDVDICCEIYKKTLSILHE